ncbi:hypothetical protein QYE76_023430 [Lolium multiflorum]|uniref:Uncharacterized protein n=1 Tax=Lolium multiflorum TaxID=4521 RepID=A0AAD8VV37_LOLMU|nr:hypothetical protein QYE76_023430 [Lolium multiflorum]
MAQKWLYIHEEYVGNQEYGIAPFDGAAEILRRRSWDAEASAEERTTTDALMKRIHQLQNTHGEELSGIQITAYFLRIRVQPLQARKTPLSMYAGEEDVDRISTDLSVKDLEKLTRCFFSLSKKDEVPTSCRVEPYSGNHALPENHQVLSSLPPLPEGGEVDERAVVHDEPQESTHPESEVAASNKSTASSDKVSGSEPTASARSLSPPPTVSPNNKRKREEVEDSGTSKPIGSTAEETSPEEGGTFYPYDDAGSVSSGEEEEEETAVPDTDPTSTSNTVVLSEARRAAEENPPLSQQNLETSTLLASPQAPSPKRARVEASESHEIVVGGSSTPSLDDPVMKHLIKLGTQFIGFRDAAEDLREALDKAEKRADALAIKLEQSEKAREKAQQDASVVEDLRQRLHNAETALSDKISQQIAREESVIAPLETQNRRFVRRMGEDFTLHEAEEDRLLDTLSILELQVKPENPEKMNKEKWKALVKDAKPQSKKIIAFLGPKPAGSTSSAKTEVK